MFYIEQEINEQPEGIRRLLKEGVPIANQIAAAIRDFNPAFMLIAARGTSDNAGRYAQYLAGVYAQLPVALAAPSIHTLYDAVPRMDRAVVVGISQSGQSDDIRRVVEDAKKQGALTIAITNASDSPLANDAKYHLPILAGEEVAVAATKSYTAQLAAIAMLVAAVTQNAELSAGLAKLPDWMADTLKANASIAAWSERYRYMDRFASIGRGYNYCTAFELSLKIKELCSITGVEYSEADFRHGPIALVQAEFPVITVAPKGKTLPLMTDLLAKLQERHAECLVISNDKTALDYGRKAMPIPADVPEWLSPITAILPGQMFAMNLALAKGYNVDKPIGLSKVTITS